MAISYERTRTTSAEPQPVPVSAPQSAPPLPTPTHAQRGPDGLRVDLAEAVARAHPEVQHQLRGDCWPAAVLLNEHLAASEPVQHIMVVAIGRDGATNSILVVTDRRLILVAPRPQVISFPLSSITKFQFTASFLLLHGDGREYQLGAVGISQAAKDDFMRKVDYASAAATLAGF